MKDDCDVCLGERGGVPGNENRIGEVVMCDYCHAEMLMEEAEESKGPVG